MLDIRRDADIHREQGGWFDARWHFAFGGYRPAEHRGVGPLRVFNDDRLVPGAVWPMHPHSDVEGCTYVLEGTFEHADSLGGGGRLRPGAVQRMTLGSGAQHSERNGSDDEPMRFLQFWLLPDTAGLEPRSDQRQHERADRLNRLFRVMGPAGEPDLPEHVLPVNQDAHVYVSALEPEAQVEHQVADGRAGYLYLVEGRARLSGHDTNDELRTGDAVKVWGPETPALTAEDDCELIYVDVPAQFERVGVWTQEG